MKSVSCTMLSLLLLFCPLGTWSLLVPETLAEAGKIITDEVANYKENVDLGGEDLCDRYTCCDASESDCNLSTMPQDETTLLLPGGESRCIFSDSGPYAAQVIPGAKDKLVVYFQGGGACWDEASTKLGFCTTKSSPSSLNGIFDRTDERNIYKEFTIVQMLYCSGDVFGGNVTRPYEDSKGEPVVQAGLSNVQQTLNWVVNQQKSGELASTLSELVVTGCSAGSLGAQLWGNQVVKQLSWKDASIMPDSYAGYFADGVVGPLLKGFGFCSSGFLDEENYQKCMDEEILVTDLGEQFLTDAPSVAYAFIQSKTDIVQQSFYVATALSMRVPAKITPASFYAGVIDMFEVYNEYPNFVVYFVDGDQHCFTPSSVFYTADAEGPKDSGETNTGPMLSDWVAASIPLPEGNSISTVCEGTVEDTDTSKNGASHVSKEDTKYCAADLVNKSYTEHYE